MSAPNNETTEFREEYRHIRRGIRKVILANLLIILLLIALFWVNQKTGFIDQLTRYF